MTESLYNKCLFLAKVVKETNEVIQKYKPTQEYKSFNVNNSISFMLEGKILNDNSYSFSYQCLNPNYVDVIESFPISHNVDTRMRTTTSARCIILKDSTVLLDKKDTEYDIPKRFSTEDEFDSECFQLSTVIDDQDILCALLIIPFIQEVMPGDMYVEINITKLFPPKVYDELETTYNSLRNQLKECFTND